jgi:hypothetical protein
MGYGKDVVEQDKQSYAYQGAAPEPYHPAYRTEHYHPD